MKWRMFQGVSGGEEEEEGRAGGRFVVGCSGLGELGGWGVM